MKNVTWRPLLDGAIRKDALEAVEAVATSIPRSAGGPSRATTIPAGRAQMRDGSLAGGAAGLAVFYGYLSQADSRRKYEKAALRFLQEAKDAAASVTMAPSLYGGFTGIAWATAHVEGRLFKRKRNSTRDVDEVLTGYVNRSGWRGDYDLVNGLVGLGVYALERLPARAAIACLEGVVDRLAETAKRRAEGVTWHTAPDLLPPQQLKQCPRGYYNLGLAHGVAGVVVVLGAACAAGVRSRKARKLLDGAVAWLLRQKRRGRAGSRFPAWVVPGTPRESCRRAWCYGDPGVAAALLCAARSVGEKAWEREALEIARAAATRPPEEAGVVDAGLCHGAAGLGHIFNRMSQATGDVTLARAARFWFGRALAMREPGRGVGGFSALEAREDGTRDREDEPGILTGAAGVALALLAATSSIEPAWDRMLLLSTPALE